MRRRFYSLLIKARRHGVKGRLLTYAITLAFTSVLIFPAAKPLHAGSSAQGIANIRMSVLRSLKVQKTKDLDFGTTFSGTGELTLDPQAGEGAAFVVTGEPNKAYSIVLPETVTLMTEAGWAENQRIQIRAFRSSPQTTGNLGTEGTQVLHVGATRGPIAEDQAPGDYMALFTVTLAYP